MNKPETFCSPLELGLQELETLEAPGFWSGVSTGFKATAAVVSVAAASAGIAAT
ncbi:daptide-type RiPP [Rhodococcus sp. 14-2483-1-1]|uniref:daptide-type RiPP n=1 Tax=Rhodococcus sp. 14-2483-1-1 TaxID=2023148 RepID=UPI0014825981|nr:daptide-type RiPP [Rhodococcus sp. 14-2483-1-1]